MMHGMKQIIEETELRLGQVMPVSGNEVFTIVRRYHAGSFPFGVICSFEQSRYMFSMRVPCC